MKFGDWIRRKLTDFINGVKIIETYKCKVLIHVRYLNEEEDYQVVDLSRYKKYGIALLENHYSAYYSENDEVLCTFIEDVTLYKAKIKNMEIWSYRDE